MQECGPTASTRAYTYVPPFGQVAGIRTRTTGATIPRATLTPRTCRLEPRRARLRKQQDPIIRLCRPADIGACLQANAQCYALTSSVQGWLVAHNTQLPLVRSTERASLPCHMCPVLAAPPNKQTCTALLAREIR